MQIILILLIILLGLGIIVAAGSWLTQPKGAQPEAIKEGSDCATCTGDRPTCEQTCMMEAATKEIEYFDDEELDAYQGRAADSYSDSEVEQFAEILYTLRKEEVRPWSRSLHLRGIAIPNQLKDELFLIITD